MKNIAKWAVLFMLSGCSSNHYHDGKYKANVYPGGSYLNIHTEVLTVNGNEILDEKYTIGGSPGEKIKVSCVQYPDRIEFNEGGVTKILTISGNGGLELNADVIFNKINSDDSSYSIPVKSKPLTRKNKNGTITLLPDKK